MAYGTLPNAVHADEGFAFTGLAVYEHNSGYYSPIWTGEFHGVVGDGKVSEFAQGVTYNGRVKYLYLSDHRTGETRYVSLDWALNRTV
jgi:hypothetical protein